MDTGLFESAPAAGLRAAIDQQYAFCQIGVEHNVRVARANAGKAGHRRLALPLQLPRRPVG